MTTPTLPTTERKMWKRSLSVGDGALGFWKALAEVFPATREQPALGSKDSQRAGRHAEVRAAGGKKAIRHIYNAQDKQHVQTAIKTLSRLGRHGP